MLWIAIVFTVCATILIALFGLQGDNWGDVFFVSGIFGTASGYFIAAGALSRVLVWSDEVILINMFRIVRIQRDAIAGFRTPSGIYIILKNGKYLITTPYVPAKGKRLTSNKRAIRFAKEMADVLHVDPQLEDRPHGTIPEGSVEKRLRWATFRWMVSTGAVSIVIAIGLHLISK